jgi:hypothetical protein
MIEAFAIATGTVALYGIIIAHGRRQCDRRAAEYRARYNANVAAYRAARAFDRAALDAKLRG